MNFVPPKPGERRGGRSKGTPNKVNRDIKTMVVGALCAAGGEEYLLRQAEANPVAFMGLIGRVLPLQVTGENGGALVIDIRWADATPQLNGHTKPLVIEADENNIIVSFDGEDAAS
jgi:hypothetical protein